MNKYFISLLLVLGFVGVSEAALKDAWHYTECTTTVTQVFSYGGKVGAIYLSTSTENAASLGDFAILIDSVTGSQILYSTYESGQKRSPACVFTSTSSYAADLLTGMKEVINYGENGVWCGNGATLFKTRASSGEAYKAGILWKQ